MLGEPVLSRKATVHKVTKEAEDFFAKAMEMDEREKAARLLRKNSTAISAALSQIKSKSESSYNITDDKIQKE